MLGVTYTENKYNNRYNINILILKEFLNADTNEYLVN